MAKDKSDKDKIFQCVTKNVTALLQMTHRDDQSLIEKLNYKTDIFDDLGIDSIEVMDLLGMLEKEFEATFKVDKFGQRRTIGDVIEFISDQLSERNR